jgi:hypothetical protein
MTVGTSGSGYTTVGDGGPGSDRVYVHRLVAYAHGVIDSMDDTRDVNHQLHPWVNCPDHLNAENPDTHRASHLNGRPGCRL